MHGRRSRTLTDDLRAPLPFREPLAREARDEPAAGADLGSQFLVAGSSSHATSNPAQPGDSGVPAGATDGAAGGLENPRSNCSGSSRWAVLDELRKFTTLATQRTCMLRVRGAQVSVGRRDGRALFGDALPCGTRFCPNCAPRIQAQRRDEIAATVEAARDRGWVSLFLTLTMSHSRGDSLADLLDALESCWRGMTRGGFWSRTKRRFGLRHFVRVVEEQEGGENGWHPHLHVLLFLDRAEAAEYDVGALSLALTREWARLVDVAGYRASLRAQRLVEPTEEHLGLMSGYFTKQLSEDFAWEMTGQATKRSRGESRNPAELLEAAVAGDPEARLAWQELEEATKGRRLIAYSVRCRQELALPRQERTFIAAEEPAPEPAERLVCIARDDWDRFAPRAGFIHDLHEVVVTAHDASEVLWWLADRGLRVSFAPPAPPVRPPSPPVLGPPGAEWLAVL